MDEMVDTKTDAQQAKKVTVSDKSETNSAAAEEAKKAGASENKHEESDISTANDPKMLDELSSLEQEIAKMHNIQHCTDFGQADAEELQGFNATGGASTKNGSVSDEQLMDELAQTPHRKPVNKAPAKHEPVAEATLEEVDLIALLKGSDQDQEQEPAADNKKSNSELGLAQLDNVGVTIEGEGQYEIMEIDDDTISGPSPEMQAALQSTLTASRTGASRTGLAKPKLSPEQARAVALEQMADLTAQKSRRNKEVAAATAIPTGIKQQPVGLISSLNDDWNEYDSGSDNASNSMPLPATRKSPVKKSKAGIESSPPQMGSVKVLLKSVSQKTIDKPKALTEQPISTAEPSGFKRTRVIKRKIIWDPDVPETQKSFAQYASSKSGTASTTTTTTAIAATAAITTTTAAPKNLETLPKKARPPTPKTHPKRAATPAKLAEYSVPITPKRRSQTPSVPNGAAGSVAKKKKISEIDRLMGDEGAANMMQAVEREQRELSGGETANKPLMRKRALTLTGRLLKGIVAVVEPTPSPASPKKESPPKAGKRTTAITTTTAAGGNTNTTDGGNAAVDAVFTKATKARPSDSWDFVYKQRASEESMIMRRRSNSSYSSNASVSRLSLDTKPATVNSASDEASDAPANDPTFKFLKPETKANQRSDGSAPQTLANDLKRAAPLQQKDAKAAKAEQITLHKVEKVAQLVINAQLTQVGYTYKAQLLQKLTEMLNKLAKSNDCNTVLLCAQGLQFCQGIDCQELIQATLEKRRNSASHLALVLKQYLRTLATFPKPLVAGIVGNLKNLGVMQLPLLDYVVAADDCCFETNYAKLGQQPEGYALWHKHPKVSSQLQSRLFLLGERLHAPEVLEAPFSFIDKSCKTRSVNDEALAVAKLISTTTAEHYRALKKLNQTANTGSLQRLEAEFKVIADQWSSPSFQASYKRYVNDVDI